MGSGYRDRRLGDRKRDGQEQGGSQEQGGLPSHAEQEHSEQEGDEHIPLGHQRPGPAGTGRLVQRLERRGAPDTLVHASAERREITRHAPAIDAAEPAQPAEGVVPRRPLFLQQRFRLSVPNLLLPVRSKVATTMVPDDRRGGIADDLASGPQSPTDVDIGARGPEGSVEPPDGLEGAFTDRQVASRYA